jgi:hypothetical protein
MSRKALEMEHLSRYTGYMRETRRDGSYTEDTERHVMEGSGNKHFFYMAPYGNDQGRALPKCLLD